MIAGRVKTHELADYAGKRVTIAGWLHRKRRLGGITFFLIRDAWGICQVVCEGEPPLQGVSCESVVTATGMVVPADQAPGGYELRHCVWQVISTAEAPPLTLGQKKLPASLATLLQTAPVTLRHPTRRAVFRVWAAVVEAFRATLRELSFTEIATPKIVSGATEGGANVFAVDYFGRPAFLAQSPQLYKQMMVGVFERVFEVGPVFRAEPHDTVRHLNQYTSLDAEMGFISDHRDIMQIVEEVTCRMVEAGLCCCTQERWSGAAQPQPPLVRRPFPVITFWDAQELIWRQFSRDVRGEDDLSPQDEKDLGAWAKAEHGSDFLFVTGYPAGKRPFYTYPDPEHPEFTNSFDLLFRGRETVTGGQRLHRYADYLAALAARRMDSAPLAGYLAAFRHGMPPHGGFGMGLERFVAQLLELANVREAALFPRDLSRLEP